VKTFAAWTAPDGRRKATAPVILSLPPVAPGEILMVIIKVSYGYHMGLQML